MKHLCGRILPPLTAAPGVESWIASLRGCRASPSVLPAKVKATATSATSGPISSESSVKCSPPWSSLKTSQVSLPGFDLSERNYADWVTRLRQDCLQRQRSVHLTSGSGSSLLPTATDSFRGCGGDRKDEIGLDQQTRFWRTPTERDHHPCGHENRTKYVSTYQLSHQVQDTQPLARAAGAIPRTATSHLTSGD